MGGFWGSKIVIKSDQKLDAFRSGSKRAPRGARRPPRGSQEASKRPQEAPKRPPEAPKRPPRGPKRPPRGPRVAKNNVFFDMLEFLNVFWISFQNTYLKQR